MLIHLYSQATTTPKVRAAIQTSDEPGTVLAARFGVTAQTIYKWCKRESIEDRSHAASVADHLDACSGGSRGGAAAGAAGVARRPAGVRHWV